MDTADIVIVGAGIVGMAVAQEILLRDASSKILILEREPQAGLHASGRNSGVLHCGIYYGADTMKAKFCATGSERMKTFAREHGIALREDGKVIVGTREEDAATAERLLKNAADNGIRAERIDQQQLRALEPHAAKATVAIHCPTTAVIDNKAVLAKLQQLLQQKGVQFRFGCAVTGIRDPNILRTTQGEIGYGFLYNCAGAHADTLAKQYGLAGDYKLVPFKGIYWKLAEHANPWVRANIYPVPDINLPFLGVHLTRNIGQDVYIGPTAIPALGREHYALLRGIKAREGLVTSANLIQLYLANQNNFRALAHAELAKYSARHFLRAAQRLMPRLTRADMVPTAKSGIRPQLVNVKTRKLEMDYLLERTPNSLHVLNAISPAFTSAFAFAEKIVGESRA